MQSQQGYIRWFKELCNDDVAIVGGKNASLGEMYRELSDQGVPVPNGFATTADAFREVIAAADIEKQLRSILEGLNVEDSNQLEQCGERCRELIYAAGVPEKIQQEILDAFKILQGEYCDTLTVAVRSSATAEDLPTASFAGQHETYLNVAGGETLIEACKKCFASLYTDRAIRYRVDQGFDHFDIALSLGIMKMVRSDLASSGVMFTIDPESGYADIVFITSAYGLGENIVQGTVVADEFFVHKPTFDAGQEVVLRRSLGNKEVKMVYSENDAEESTHNIETDEIEQRRFSINDEEVLKLAEYAITVEKHYSERAGHPMPMDLEWAKDGEDGKLYIVQARPETVASQMNTAVLNTYEMGEHGEAILQGRAVGNKISTGTVRVINSAAELDQFVAGEVLVANVTTPDWGKIMKQAAALITDRGGRTCHAAIVARELGIPAVVGCGDATSKLKTGDVVTISCAQGEVGSVYSDALEFVTNEIDLSGIQKTKTQMMVNIGNPELAFKTAMIPNDGVGLARLEFIFTESVRVHPMAMLYPDRIEDQEIRSRVMALCRADQSPTEYLIEKISEGVATIAAAFYPKPVIVRLSDFKTNEYASLLGGADFEPHEDNPMLGFRGASRYAHEAYAEGFSIECAAFKKVREEMGFTNVKIMIPFCRTVAEAETVLNEMQQHGLARGEDGLEIYVMCEIPNNVILIDEFAKHFDGFSIGSNDLTQLTLGVDRDSELVAFDFDERNDGVLEMMRLTVEGAKRNSRYCGICGQAPSDYPEVAEFLVKAGIDSLSLTPDSLLQTTIQVAKIEAEISGA